MQTDLPLAGADDRADFFGALGRPFALAFEIPAGVKVHSWGKHPLVCVEQLDTSTTLRSLTLGTVMPTNRLTIVFATDVEPADVLPTAVEWTHDDGFDCKITHHKGNELCMVVAGNEVGEPGAVAAFLRGLDDYWLARGQAEAEKAGEMALLVGIYAACGTPFPERDPRSYGAALKKLTLSTVKGATGLTKPMLDFIEKHDGRATLVGWCGGARAKLVAAEAMAALTASNVAKTVNSGGNDVAAGIGAKAGEDGSVVLTEPQEVWVWYRPEDDTINNHGIPFPLDDYSDVTDEEMRKATLVLPTSKPEEAPMDGGIWIRVLTDPTPGVTYGQLRAAAARAHAELANAEAGAPDDFDASDTLDASDASQNGSVEAEPRMSESVSQPDPFALGGANTDKPLTTDTDDAEYDADHAAGLVPSDFQPRVWITEASCNLKVLKGRVFKFGPKNLIYGLNKDGKTTLVTAIRLALGQRAPEFGVHASRAASGDLYNLRAPGEKTAQVHLTFSNGMKFGWALNANGSITTHGQIPATTYALDGVEEAVTGNSTGMLGLLNAAGIEVVPRSYVGQVLGPHLPTLVTVITDDTATKLHGDTPMDQLLGAYKTGLQLVLGGFKAVKDAKKRRSGSVKESESISHQNSLLMDNLAGQMEALAPVLGYPSFRFATFFTDDDQRSTIMTDVSAKATSATRVDKTALANTLNQQQYNVTAARGNLTRAEARLAEIAKEGTDLKHWTMANPLPETEPTARERELAESFLMLFSFGQIMTKGRSGAMGCPVCATDSTVEAIHAHMDTLAASPVAARFAAVRNYTEIRAQHDRYTAKGTEYRTQRDVIKEATVALAQAEAMVATTEAQIAAAESNVNPVAVSAESFVTAFMRYRELFVTNRASAKWREGESAFITGPLTQAIQAFKVAADSLRDYTVERLRGLIAEHTGDDSVAIDVFGRNIVVGESAPGHDEGIMLGTSKSQTCHLIGNICSMLYGSQELKPGVLYLAETGDVAWTEPHLSETLRGWANNRLQWFVQSTVKPEAMPEGWTLIDLSAGA